MVIWMEKIGGDINSDKFAMLITKWQSINCKEVIRLQLASFVVAYYCCYSL